MMAVAKKKLMAHKKPKSRMANAPKKKKQSYGSLKFHLKQAWENS